MNLIVNADDFGMSHAVNTAIRDSFAKGLVSSTTLLANMDGFSEAMEMILAGTIPRGCIGIHLNLFEGVPLTDAMRRNRLYCDADGKYRYLQGSIPFMAPARIAGTVVYEELKAQIEKILKVGVTPSHLDSHGHYHSNWFVQKTVIDLAHEFKIPFIRTSPNLSRRNLRKRLLNLIFNRKKRLQKSGVKKCDWMGNIEEIEINFPQLSGWCEMMVHPVYDTDGKIIDAEYRKPLDELLEFSRKTMRFSYSGVLTEPRF